MSEPEVNAAVYRTRSRVNVETYAYDPNSLRLEITRDGFTLGICGDRTIVRRLLEGALEEIQKLEGALEEIQKLEERLAPAEPEPEPEPDPDGYMLVSLERDEIYSKEQAEHLAKIAAHQGVRLALVAPEHVHMYDPGARRPATRPDHPGP